MMSMTETRNLARARARDQKDVYYFGVDLGKAADHSALAIVKKTVFPNPNYTGPPPRGFEPSPHNNPKLKPDVFHIAALERYPLQTYYRDVRADVYRRVKMLKDEGAHVVLAVDQTGVGGSEVEAYQLENPHKAVIEPVYITSGAYAHSDRGVNYVPKNELITTTNTWMQDGILRMANALASTQPARDFKRELQQFSGKQKLTTGHVTLEAWREQDHDDLVLAVAMAVWSANRDMGAEPFVVRNFVRRASVSRTR